jgi:predicted DNA binding CopG/RHH family protein
MALNLQAELEALYNASKSKEQSLSDRLNAMDKYGQTGNPALQAQVVDFSNRPIGYNPMNDIKTAFEMEGQYRNARSGVLQDVASQQKNTFSLLDQLQQLAEKEKDRQQQLADRESDRQFQLQKEALTKGILSYNPKTGKLEVSKSSDEIEIAAKNIMAGSMKLTDIPTEKRNKVAEKLAELGYSNDEFASQKTLAQSTINELERLFGRGIAANVGTEKDLSLAGSGNILERLGALIGRQTKKVTDPTLIEDANSYNSILSNAVGLFSQALGSGVPQEGEAKRLIESAPQLGSSDREAKAWFANARRLLATPEMKQLLKEKSQVESGLDSEDEVLIQKYKK